MRLLPENPPNISERAVRRAWTVVGVLAVIVLVMTVVGLVRLSNSNEALTDKVERSDAERVKLGKRLDAEEAESAKLKQGSAALGEQVERLGGKPVVDPANPTAPPRALGPTDAQVLDAVKVICAGTSACVPTKAQVTVALRAICGDCRGEDGADAKTPADGRDGDDGEDGEDAPAVTDAQIDAAVARNCGVDGCRGPGPTDEQLDDRIAAYCAARGDCRGKDAVIVPSGMDCPEGERVNGVHLLADGSLTVSCAPLIGRE